MPQLRMADLLSALSITMDLAMAHAPEQSVRACLVAAGLARQIGLPESEVADVYYATLLRHIGCTATAHEESALFGDELVLRPYAERTDPASRRDSLALLLRTGQGTGVRRLGYLARTVRAGPAAEYAILRAICEVGSMLADRLELGAPVTAALGQMLERWDGG
ncbi:MAG: hypothetical protein ACRDTM_09325, partial [Micromonosporaceae bacterium]